jgi:hypothetical protein
MRNFYSGDTGSYRLYAFGERRVLALTSRRAAERLVKKGRAEEGVDVDGKTVCFRMLVYVAKPSKARESAADKLASNSEESSTAFSQAELLAIAGRHFRHGRSRTARMTDAQRAARINPKNGRKLPEEDIVERATNKYDAWQQIGSLLQEVKTVESACL